MAGTMLGLDIGSNTIKMVQCRDGLVLGSAVRTLPEGMMQNDRISDTNRLGDLLREMVREHKFHARRVAIVVSNEVCFLRELTMPRMTADQLEKNLPYEFSSYVDGDLKDYAFDYEMLKPVAPEDEEMELMAAAVPESLLEEMRSFLRRARLRLARVAPTESAFQALIRRAEGIVKEQKEFCFLNLGYNATRMYMYKSDRHQATRVLETGLRDLESAIAQAMDVDRQTAHGYLMENYQDCQNMEASMEIYRDVSVELMRALNFYRFSNPDSTLENLWLCGGGSAIQPLRHTIRDTLGIHVHRADSLIRNGAKLEDSFNFVQAVGVTMDWK